MPESLRPVFGRQQIRQSLQTKDPKLAKAWAYVLSAKFLDEFRQCRNPMAGFKLEDLIKAASNGQRYELNLPNGLSIKANDEADHARALEAIGKLERMGALQQGRPLVSALSNPAWHPAKLLLLSDGIKQHLHALKPSTLPKTYNIKRLALEEFRKWKGNKPLPEISRPDLADYCQHLITNGKAKPTIVNKFTYLKEFFGSMQAGGYYNPDDNPATGHIKYSRKERRQRKKLGFEPFLPAELQAIFKPENLTIKKNKEHHYWAPWIGLYTGARVSEVCQLALDDFIEEDGLPCFHFTDDGQGQKLKNQSSRRVVPIHPKLVELGLLDFVKHQRAKGQTKLFPKLQDVLNGAGDAESKAFGRYLDKLHIEAKTGKKGFHSFRKTITHKMQDHKIPAEFRAQFLGHDLEDEHFQSYSRKYSAKELADVIFPSLG